MVQSDNQCTSKHIAQTVYVIAMNFVLSSTPFWYNQTSMYIKTHCSIFVCHCHELCAELNLFVHPMHIWQSRIEINYFSVAYFERITKLDML